MTAVGRPVATARTSDLWLRSYEAPVDAPRVYCFPHSGGGPATFRRWQLQTDELALHAVALPGRERRIEEPAGRHVAEVVGPVSEAIVEREHGRQEPVVLLGVSLGALLGHLVARRLAAQQVPVALLVTIGAAAPHLPPPPPVHDLDDESLVQWLLRLGGMEPHILDYPELLRLVLPAVRADLELSTHQVSAEPEDRLDVPVLSVVGAEDPVCSLEEAARWSELTTASARRLVVPGGHLPADSVAREVLREVEQELRRGPPAGGGQAPRPAPATSPGVPSRHP